MKLLKRSAIIFICMVLLFGNLFIPVSAHGTCTQWPDGLHRYGYSAPAGGSIMYNQPCNCYSRPGETWKHAIMIQAIDYCWCGTALSGMYNKIFDCHQVA